MAKNLLRQCDKQRHVLPTRSVSEKIVLCCESVFLHLCCSKLDEDNLYMAYADIMAKVRSANCSVLLASWLLMVRTIIVIDFQRLELFNWSCFLVNH